MVGCSRPEDDWDRLAERDRVIEEKTRVLLEEGYLIGLLALRHGMTDTCEGLVFLVYETTTSLEESIDAELGFQQREKMLADKPRNYRELEGWAELINAREAHIETNSKLMAKYFEIGLEEGCWPPEKRSKLR